MAGTGVFLMAGGTCPYATLGIGPGASPDDVRTAFRRAALRTHPDKQGGSSEAFNAVQSAYEALLVRLGPDLLSSSSAGAGGAAPFAASGGVSGAAAAFDPWGGAAGAATFKSVFLVHSKPI